MKNQIETGLQVAETFMEKRALMVCSTDKSTSGSVTSLVRKMISEASMRFPSVTLRSMHHLGFVDMSKFGRMTAIEIDQCARWCHKVLAMNEEFSNLLDTKRFCFKKPFVLCQSFFSKEGATQTKPRHGAYSLSNSKNQGIEDKFTSMGMELKLVQIALDLSGQHGNRTLGIKNPLVFTKLVFIHPG